MVKEIDVVGGRLGFGPMGKERVNPCSHQFTYATRVTIKHLHVEIDKRLKGKEIHA